LPKDSAAISSNFDRKSRGALMSVEDFLSLERLTSYYDNNKEPLSLAIARYQWNLRLCAALYTPLHVFEIGLRNSVHRAISTKHGSEWLETPNTLSSREQATVQDALSKLRKLKPSVTTGKLIAELSFGFWVALLYKKYESSATKQDHAFFWPFCLMEAFPHIPRNIRKRSEILRRLERIKELRNRVFHHEPILKIPTLKERYDEILEAISWLQGDSSVLLSECNFLEILHSQNPDGPALPSD